MIGCGRASVAICFARILIVLQTRTRIKGALIGLDPTLVGREVALVPAARAIRVASARNVLVFLACPDGYLGTVCSHRAAFTRRTHTHSRTHRVGLTTARRRRTHGTCAVIAGRTIRVTGAQDALVVLTLTGFASASNDRAGVCGYRAVARITTRRVQIARHATTRAGSVPKHRTIRIRGTCVATELTPVFAWTIDVGETLSCAQFTKVDLAIRVDRASATTCRTLSRQTPATTIETAITIDANFIGA